MKNSAPMPLQSKLITLLLLLLTANLYSQKDYFNFTQIKIKDIAAIEKGFDSKAYFIKSTHYYGGKKEEYAQPIHYRRSKTVKLPEASVVYFYSKKDSIVKNVSFQWKVNANEEEQSKRIKKYNKEFDRIVKYLSRLIGEPAPEQGQTKLVESVVQNEPTTVYDNERRVEWRYKNCKVMIVLVWTKGHGEGMATSIKWDE